jgi:hypothetical protein
MAALSGQQTVTTAGTAVPLGTQAIGGPLAVKALAANTGVVVIGCDGAGDVTTSNGFQLAAGEVIIFNHAAHLGNIWVDAAVNGEGVCWLALDI